MAKCIFILFLWTLSVGNSNGIQESKQTRITVEPEPNAYTISFFKLPNRATNEILKSHRKRDSDDLSAHEKIKEDFLNSSTSKVVHPLKERKQNINLSTNITKSINKNTILEKEEKREKGLSRAENSQDVDLDRGKTTIKTLEPWSLGPLHNMIHFSGHQLRKNEHTAESYQEGSINHPSHTMYPMCHQCPRNSSYQDCVNKRTLKRCNNGLDNICYTKSFQSKTRGLIYEMGCSNHKMCQKAKAKPCKGEIKKCFVCCQFDGCNAQRHNYSYYQNRKEDDNLKYSVFGNAAQSVTCDFFLVLGMTLLIFIMQK
ncbi:uncharacterized protein LOC124440591 isoform X2 [Xenia sp. Carnegie-2017]|nr:uncharacterized protein LOC124440591 isoform X2 [Xenia sp. Carnegie-2017]XP_046846948.1 uncharacterized protein LOC124440591 isoform X2 [Xenia sp. Carnegie-2017]